MSLDGQETDVRASTDPTPCRITIRGRCFAHEEILRIRSIIEASPGDHRFALSKRISESLGWVQPNGRLKDRSCRDALRKLHEQGIIRLPPPRRPPVKRQRVPITEKTAPGSTVSIDPRIIGLSSLVMVTGSGDRRQERLWNEYTERYHYLGYGVPIGPHIKYFVMHDSNIIGCLAFAGAAWRVEARDRWIGWSKEHRHHGLRFVVNNTRFLLLPWIKAPNLASRVLALAARRLPGDWLLRYAYRPLLLETFVDIERHAGTCYRAANWVCVGQTKGRGKMDRHFKADQPRKAVFVYPLVMNATGLLRAR